MDFQGFTVSRVLVDGRAATFTREDTKLIIDPAGNGCRSATARPSQCGSPTPACLSRSRIRTAPRRAGSTPTTARSWWASRSARRAGSPTTTRPRDKATFEMRTTVPTGLASVVGTVIFVGTSTSAWARPRGTGARTARCRPISQLRRSGAFDVTRALHAERHQRVQRRRHAPSRRPRRTARTHRSPASRGIVEDFSSRYGRYPFGTVGAAVDRAGFVGYALESQSVIQLRPAAVGRHGRPRDLAPVVRQRRHPARVGRHLAERGLRRMESSGTGATATDGDPSPAELWDENYARPEDDDLWSVPPANPAAEEIFVEAIYTRGAMTLEGLRQIIGRRPVRRAAPPLVPGEPLRRRDHPRLHSPGRAGRPSRSGPVLPRLAVRGRQAQHHARRLHQLAPSADRAGGLRRIQGRDLPLEAHPCLRRRPRPVRDRPDGRARPSRPPAGFRTTTPARRRR